MRTKDFVRFIKVRETARVGHDAGAKKPWVGDPIIQRYRFCNVRREDDRVTKWIARNWRTPLAKDDELWFWMLVARLINHPPTLGILTTMAMRNKWNAQKFVDVIEREQAVGCKAWGGAYIVSTNGNKMPKAQYIAERVLSPAWEKRKLVTPKMGDTLAVFCGILMTLNGVQGFIAGQVIADAKYVSDILMCASDWDTFAISGPGSRRGLNRVVGRKLNETWKEAHWHDELSALRAATNAALGWKKPLHAQDIQNCLCEFDKYERVRLGEGKPRATYPGV